MMAFIAVVIKGSRFGVVVKLLACREMGLWFEPGSSHNNFRYLVSGAPNSQCH